MGYQFSILYKPGRDNNATNALSRVTDEHELRSLLSYPRWLDSDSLLDGFTSDPHLQKLMAALSVDPNSHPGFSLLHGKL